MLLIRLVLSSALRIVHIIYIKTVIPIVLYHHRTTATRTKPTHTNLRPRERMQPLPLWLSLRHDHR